MTDRFLPFSAERIDILCGLVTLRPVWRYGVELNGRQRYTCGGLQAIRTRFGVRENGRSILLVKIKHFDRDIGNVHVLDPSNQEWLLVPHVRPDYADGISLHEHRMNVRYAQIEHFDSDDYDKLLEAKERLKVEVARLRQSASLQDRRRFAKIAGVSGAAPEGKTPKTASSLPKKDSQVLAASSSALRRQEGHSDMTEDDQEIDAFDELPLPPHADMEIPDEGTQR